MPAQQNFDGKWRGQKLFRQYVEQQRYGALIILVALGFVFAVSLWGEVLR